MNGYEVIELEEQGLRQPGKSSDKFLCIFESTGLSRNKKTKFNFCDLKNKSEQKWFELKHQVCNLNFLSGILDGLSLLCLSLLLSQHQLLQFCLTGRMAQTYTQLTTVLLLWQQATKRTNLVTYSLWIATGSCVQYFVTLKEYYYLLQKFAV